MFARMLSCVFVVATSGTVYAQQSRTAELEAEAQRLASAALRATDMAVKVATLTALARIYDVENLNNLPLLELTLRDLIAIRPNDPALLYRLAQVQEDQGSIDAAEQTLLWARQQHPSEADVYRRLSQFYSRRVRGWRFTPTMFEGRPVRVRLNTMISFR